MKTKTSILSKTTSEMFFSQFIWAIYYFIAIVVIYIGLNVFFNASSSIDNPIGSFFLYSTDLTDTFMFIIGIIASSFLSYFISNGVTRKNIFKGTVLAAGGLSVVLVMITGALSGLLFFIMNLMNLPVVTLSVVSEGGIIKTIGNLFVFLLVYSFYLFFYYLIGWFIGAGFYKYGWILGVGFVAGSIILASLLEWFSLNLFVQGDLLSEVSPNTVLNALSNIALIDLLRLDQVFALPAELPLIVSIAGIVGVIAALLFFIRMLTRDIYVDL